MSIRIVRLGDARISGEGLRLGTVRRPPRGVPKGEFGKRDYYDVWFPTLAPSEPLLKTAGGEWKSFVRAFLAEMKTPNARHALDLLAALSHTTDFSLGCYCVDENRCHRSLLRDLLLKRGAKVL